jgi:ABC-2 type transport system ATP-binding protein
MEQVEEICDKIILVNKGKKILDGTVSAIRQEYKEHLFRVGFEQVPEYMDSDIFSVVKKEAGSLVVRINDGYNTNNLLEHFIRQGALITAFSEILPTINDIFIKLVSDTPTARQFQSTNS